MRQAISAIFSHMFVRYVTSLVPHVLVLLITVHGVKLHSFYSTIFATLYVLLLITVILAYVSYAIIYVRLVLVLLLISVSAVRLWLPIKHSICRPIRLVILHVQQGTIQSWLLIFVKSAISHVLLARIAQVPVNHAILHTPTLIRLALQLVQMDITQLQFLISRIKCVNHVSYNV